MKKDFSSFIPHILKQQGYLQQPTQYAYICCLMSRQQTHLSQQLINTQIMHTSACAIIKKFNSLFLANDIYWHFLEFYIVVDKSDCNVLVWTQPYGNK